MRVFLALAAVLLTACATSPPPIDRAAWLSMTTRTVEHKPEQVIAAAEQVLKLADPPDTRISHRPDGLDAVRHAATFAIVAIVSEYFHWTVTATPDGQKTAVRVSVTWSNSGAGAAPVAPGVAAPMSFGSGAAQAIQDPKLYALFWSRLESLLGNGKWTTCDEYGASIWGTTALALCGVGREDLRP